MRELLYEATAGRLPLDAETFNELLFKIVLEPCPRDGANGTRAPRIETNARCDLTQLEVDPSHTAAYTTSPGANNVSAFALSDEVNIPKIKSANIPGSPIIYDPYTRSMILFEPEGIHAFDIIGTPLAPDLKKRIVGWAPPHNQCPTCCHRVCRQRRRLRKNLRHVTHKRTRDSGKHLTPTFFIFCEAQLSFKGSRNRANR